MYPASVFVDEYVISQRGCGDGMPYLERGAIGRADKIGRQAQRMLRAGRTGDGQIELGAAKSAGDFKLRSEQAAHRFQALGQAAQIVQHIRWWRIVDAVRARRIGIDELIEREMARQLQYIPRYRIAADLSA